jgi:lauroyl/myristoyl acyltransferase
MLAYPGTENLNYPEQLILRLKVIVRYLFSIFDDMLRIASMSLILYPSAYILPRKFAVGIADVLSMLLLISPGSIVNAYLQMRCGFGKGWLGSLALAYKWLRQPFRDFVLFHRIINRREALSNWNIVEKNVEAVKTLRESGEPYVVATGHFLREAILSVGTPKIPGHPILLVAEMPERVRSLYELRIRIQFGALLKAASYLEKETDIVSTGISSYKKILGALREKGNVLLIHIDVPWWAVRSGSFPRPFAGHQSLAFSTGAVRLARLAQCPVVSCTYYVEDDGTVVLGWGSPICPKKAADDVRITNALLNDLEIAIGERPTQYILNIGRGRRWNSDKKCWETTSTTRWESSIGNR